MRVLFHNFTTCFWSRPKENRTGKRRGRVYNSYLKGTASEEEYFFGSLEKKVSTFWTCSDGFRFLRPPCWRENKKNSINILLAYPFKKLFVSRPIPFKSPLVSLRIIICSIYCTHTETYYTTPTPPHYPGSISWRTPIEQILIIWGYFLDD